MAERAAKQLELNKSELPNSITEVIATLSRAGFDAYIVGGGVRDTLLGLRPKDFDAVTDAKPHEIKDIFGKRCRIIGRRFQLAHVYSGRELIEVATFRGPPNNNANTNQDGMILRDNVWGDIKQDFARRDFSINALYYQPLKGVVHDFCGALDDIRTRTIRLLGNAPVRIEEDPVRLLRALRFKAKLGFEFDDELAEQFHDGNWALLEQISPHRLYDETQKMFTGGYLVPLLPLLFESGAIDSLIIYPPSEPNALVKQVAINTDKRINAGKSINPAFFYAALLWENYLHQLEKAKKRNMPFAEAQLQAASKVIDRQRIKTAIPKFAEQFIRDIWVLQPKLAAPRTRQIEQLSEHPRFRAGFDFLLLREQCGDSEHPLSESTNEMGEWWQHYQTLSEAQKQQAIEDFDENIRRGAYKREKNGQRGRNRQKQTDTNNEPSNELSNQPITKDTPSVPAHHQRAAHSSNTQSNNVSVVDNSKQITQDHHELAQLQQLSLANNRHKKTANPAPLFVIEHENVVPPLKKQLAEKSISINDSSDNKAAPRAKKQPLNADTAVNSKQNSSKDVNAEQTVDKRSVKIETSTVPQAPQLVTNNSEPIPHQRRRRQPSEVESTATTTVNGAAASYDRKAPKTITKAAQQVETNVKTKPSVNTKPSPKATKPAKTMTDKKINADSKGSTNKGAVPAKRRRRQPSSDTI